VDLAVIIPCHNEASTLPQQLDALAAQEWGGTWEVVVVDNGSTDRTSEVASGHPGLQGRLRVVRAADQRGVAYARRAGVEASKADAVAFCDGDDVVGVGWVAAIGDALREHELVTGAVELDLLNDPSTAQSRGRGRPGAAPTYGSVPFLRGNNGGMQRTTWDELGGFDPCFHGLEDIELSLRAVARGQRVHFEPRALVHYRYRADLRGLWQQGLFYGRSQPMLRRRCRELGLPPPPRSSGWRSWAWLALNLPRAPRRAVRPRWLWTLACRIGALREAARVRLPAPSGEPLPAASPPIRPGPSLPPAAYSAAIVTFRRPDSLRAVLAGLEAQEHRPALVVVADNDPQCSARQAVLDVAASSPLELVYLPVGENLGPAGGWARAQRSAAEHPDRGAWLAVFDDDDPVSGSTVMLRLCELAAQAADDVAALGLRGSRLRRTTATLHRVDPSPGGTTADYLASNGAPLYRWSAIDEGGFFDERLFFGFEDLDLGLRLRQRGWQLVVVPSEGLHVVSDTSATRTAWREHYKTRSLVVVCRRHLGAVALVATLVRTLLLASPRLALADPRLALVRARWRGAADGLRGCLGPGTYSPAENPAKPPA
jgi:GT2 family glycosyltransferase